MHSNLNHLVKISLGIGGFYVYIHICASSGQFCSLWVKLGHIWAHPFPCGPLALSIFIHLILYETVYFQDLIKRVFTATMRHVLWVYKTVYMILYCKSVYCVCACLCVCVCVNREDSIYSHCEGLQKESATAEKAATLLFPFVEWKHLIASALKYTLKNKKHLSLYLSVQWRYIYSYRLAEKENNGSH